MVNLANLNKQLEAGIMQKAEEAIKSGEVDEVLVKDPQNIFQRMSIEAILTYMQERDEYMVEKMLYFLAPEQIKALSELGLGVEVELQEEATAELYASLDTIIAEEEAQDGADEIEDSDDGADISLNEDDFDEDEGFEEVIDGEDFEEPEIFDDADDNEPDDMIFEDEDQVFDTDTEETLADDALSDAEDQVFDTDADEEILDTDDDVVEDEIYDTETHDTGITEDSVMPEISDEILEGSEDSYDDEAEIIENEDNIPEDWNEQVEDSEEFVDDTTNSFEDADEVLEADEEILDTDFGAVEGSQSLDAGADEIFEDSQDFVEDELIPDDEPDDVISEGTITEDIAYAEPEEEVLEYSDVHQSADSSKNHASPRPFAPQPVTPAQRGATPSRKKPATPLKTNVGTAEASVSAPNTGNKPAKTGSSVGADATLSRKSKSKGTAIEPVAGEKYEDGWTLLRYLAENRNNRDACHIDVVSRYYSKALIRAGEERGKYFIRNGYLRK